MEGNREKAIALVNAFFDGKDIVMRDLDAGVPNWVSVNHPEYWSYLTMFCKNVDKYQVIEKPKKLLKCKIGDCFYTKDCVGNTSLIKIADIGDSGWLGCSEISIDKDVIDRYNVSYHTNDTSDWVPINAEIFNEVEKICNELDTQVNYMYKGAVVMIKKLCQEVNQNQEK